MADGSTLKTAMKTIKEDQLFWTREVYERVLFQQLKTPRDPKGKGKGKDKGKKGGKTKGVYQDHLKNNPGKGSGKNDKASKGGRPHGWPRASGVQYCGDFHLKHSCPGNCGRSHACPVRINGWTTTLLTNAQARGKLEPSWTPELIAGMIQRAGKRAPRMTSQSGLRSMGEETWRTILCQRPNHNFPIQPCGRHLRVRNPPIFQKPKRTYQSPGGASLLRLPLWTFHSYKHFFHGPPLSQSGSNEGSFGTHQYITIRGTDTQLLLYTGKKDSQSLDSVLLGLQSSLEGHIIALGLRRSEDHDILRGDLYSRLCVSAWMGYIQGTGGGPNCRTWSILRWFPKPGFPKPVRVDKNQTVGGSQSSKPQRAKTRTMTACSYSDSCSYATSPR